MYSLFPHNYYDELNGRAGVSWSITAELRRNAAHTSALPYSTGCIQKTFRAVEGGCRRLGVTGVDDGCSGEEEGRRKEQNKMGITDPRLRIAMMDRSHASENGAFRSTRATLAQLAQFSR
jgi:hypothetical protein